MAVFIPKFRIDKHDIDMYNQNMPLLVFNRNGFEYVFGYHIQFYGEYRQEHQFIPFQYYYNPIVLNDSFLIPIIEFSKLIKYSFKRIDNVIEILKNYKEPTNSIIYNDIMTPQGFFKTHEIKQYGFNDFNDIRNITPFKHFSLFNEFHKQILLPYFNERLKTIKTDIKRNVENKSKPKPKPIIPESLKPITQELKDISKEAKQGVERHAKAKPKANQKEKDKKKDKKKENKIEITQTLDSLKNPPYRSFFKLDKLYQNQPEKYNEAIKRIQPLNTFDIKENKKKYHLKVCSKVKNVYIGDIFFQSNKFNYLLLINVNSRKAYYKPLGKNYKPIENYIDVDTGIIKQTFINVDIKKDTETMIKAFNELFEEGLKINALEFDGEKSIASKQFQEYLHSKNIHFIPLHPGSHTSTSLLDRVCRTIRDIAFNLGYDIITNEIMNKIITIYNEAPHKTLTKILFNKYPNLKLKYKFGISPNDVENNEKLESAFVEECLKYNALIKSQDDYLLYPGDKVRIYNKNINDNVFESSANKINKRSVLSKDIYIVVGYENSLIKLQKESPELGEKYNIIYKPRRDLKLI